MRVRTGRFETLGHDSLGTPSRSKYAMVSTILSSRPLLGHHRWQLPTTCLATSSDAPSALIFLKIVLGRFHCLSWIALSR